MSDSYDDEDDTRKSDDDDTTERNDHGKKSDFDEVPPAKNVGRKRTIDESTLNPHDARKLETRRAYNRQCAAKARKRNKDLVAHLQNQVEDLTREKIELKRTTEVMRAQMNLLEETNRSLLLNQMANGGGAIGLGGLGAFGGAGRLLGAPGLGAGMHGVLGGAGASQSTLLDQVAMERVAAQIRFQTLHQASAQGALDNSNNNGENLDTIKQQGFFR